MQENFDVLLEKGIVATHKSYPDRNMNLQLKNALGEYFSILEKDGTKNKEAINLFCKCFTREDEDTKESIRSQIKKNPDAVLSLIDCVYNFCVDEISDIDNISKKDKKIDTYIRFIEEYITTIKSYGTGKLVNARDNIYKFPYKTGRLINLLNQVLPSYVDSVLNKQQMTVRITETTDTAKQIFSNIKDINSYELKDDFHGVYKTGNINVQIASTLGYKKKNKPQQDAVLSIAKGNCSMHVVADGAGGSNKGQIASTLIVQGLKEWFEKSDFSAINTIDKDNNKDLKSALSVILRSFDEAITSIDKKIKNEYPGSYSTFVASIVTPDFIIISNVGDSTAYLYDDERKVLEEQTILDSPSRMLSYEEARYNPLNNQITNAVGAMDGNAHYCVLKNKGPYRLVLSSDGITDLISEDNFMNLTTKGYTAADYVRKADQDPDVSPNMKSEDNISAIVIDSEEFAKRRRAR